MPPTELRGKTMLLLGLGGSGMQIARRANAFGMRVRALDDGVTQKPGFVFSLEKLSELEERLPAADVVVLALPRNEKTHGIIGAKEVAAVKKGAFLVNAAHTALIDLSGLEVALVARKDTPIAVGLDTTDIGPLAKGHALRKRPGVVLTAHEGGPSAEARRRQWRLYRENVRRFVAGEPLLCVVVAEKKE